jgi:hypothetical protein
MVPGREGARMHPDHPVDPVQGPEPFFASAAEGQDWLSGWQSWGWFGCDERPRGPGHNRDAVGAGFEWDPGLASFLGQPWLRGATPLALRGRGAVQPKWALQAEYVSSVWLRVEPEMEAKAW